MVDICLLGSGGGMPMPFRNLSSTLLSYKGRKILIDCGEGTQVSMKMIGWGFKTLDLICITHCHGDHIVGLPGLLATLGNSGRTTKVTIIGPQGITKVIEGISVLFPYLPYELEVIENPALIEFTIDNNGIKVTEGNGEIKLTTLELEHSAPCIGYSFYIKRNRKFIAQVAEENNVPKVLWGKLQKGENVFYEGKEYHSNMVLGAERRGIKISLTTDTRPLPSIKEFIRDSDLFICEGTYGDSLDIDKAIANKHMTFKEAAELAHCSKVYELLLTHFSPAMLDPNEFINEATTVFPNTIIGEDRLVKTLKFSEENI